MHIKTFIITRAGNGMLEPPIGCFIGSSLTQCMPEIQLLVQKDVRQSIRSTYKVHSFAAKSDEVDHGDHLNIPGYQGKIIIGRQPGVRWRDRDRYPDREFEMSSLEYPIYCIDAVVRLG